MAGKTPDAERLKHVCEGYELLTTHELVALIFEIACEKPIQRKLASAVMAKMLRHAEEEIRASGVVVTFRERRKE